MTEIFRKQVQSYEKENILFRGERENVFSRVVSFNTATDYILTCYENVRKEVIASQGGGNLWIEKGEGNLKTFVVFVQLFYNRRATMLKIQRWHSILFSQSFRIFRFEIDND